VKKSVSLSNRWFDISRNGDGFAAGGIEAHSFLPLITAELFADVQRRIGPVGVTTVATNTRRLRIPVFTSANSTLKTEELDNG
jgi:hypothetical protein